MDFFRRLTSQLKPSSIAPNFEYEMRAVAFLDILGWKALVERSVTEPSIMQSISRAVGWIFSTQETVVVDSGMQDFLSAAQFSDSIVVSVSLKPRGDRINPPFQLYACCCILSRLLMKEGIFVRGGTTDGQMYHSGSIAFGPALTAAYDLESRIAVTPRIVTPSRSTGEPRGMFASDPKTGFRTNFWRKDKSDNLHFLDVLGSFSGVPKCDLVVPGHPELSTRLEDFASPIRTALIEAERQRDERIVTKYRWLLDYYNQVAAEFDRERLEV
jgi:hypothetical protein